MSLRVCGGGDGGVELRMWVFIQKRNGPQGWTTSYWRKFYWDHHNVHVNSTVHSKRLWRVRDFKSLHDCTTFFFCLTYSKDRLRPFKKRRKKPQINPDLRFYSSARPVKNIEIKVPTGVYGYSLTKRSRRLILTHYTNRGPSCDFDFRLVVPLISPFSNIIHLHSTRQLCLVPEVVFIQP